MMMQGFGQSVGSLMMILAVVIAILWIALPFAVFGIKKLLSQRAGLRGADKNIRM